MDRAEFESYITDKLLEIRDVFKEFAADQTCFPRICASIGDGSVWAFAFVNDDTHEVKLIDVYKGGLKIDDLAD